jgi:riboflavin kinase / FMN adenylyltransferase
MKTVFRSLDEARDNFGPCALTIGNFDGVHLGHRTLIRQTQQVARRNGWKAAVLTFDPHPTAIVAPERTPKLICSLQERLRLLEEAGADRVLVLPFGRDIAAMSPREFVEQVLVGALDSKAVMVGQNFRFGCRQAGNASTLAELARELKFEVHFLAPVIYRGELVSSSAVRQHIAAGEVAAAGRLLARCFYLEGEVVRGHGVGSKQTVPTLNLKPGTEISPRHGVYVTQVEDLEDGRVWRSVTNIGVRPTFGGDEVTIESFLLSPFDGRNPDRIRVHFRHWLREERKFPDPQALRNQILHDVGRADEYWRLLNRFSRQ